MESNFQTNLSGEFTAIKSAATVMLRGKGRHFEKFKAMLDDINRPDLKKIIIERRV